MKLEFAWQILEQIRKCKISWQSVQWEPSWPMRTDGRMDGYDEAHSQLGRGWGTSKHNCLLSYLLCWRHVSTKKSHSCPCQKLNLMSVQLISLPTELHRLLNSLSPFAYLGPSTLVSKPTRSQRLHKTTQQSMRLVATSRTYLFMTLNTLSQSL